MLTVVYILYIFACLFFVYKRTLVLMHFFQQEEYDNSRFIIHIIKHPKLIDKKLTMLSIILFLATNFISNTLIHFVLLSIILVLFGYLQRNPLQNSKKPLIFTARVKRLFNVIMLTFSCILVNVFFKTKINSWELYVLTIVLVQIIPFIIITSNVILFPVEKFIQLKYLKAATAKLAECSPVIIGITGSYGKTSTKHILAHILSSSAPTLATPGSVNTSMGITKIIREQLKSEHKFFIVEMGAYGKGSIARLCKLTPPSYGIITAIGDAHFERFKTIENVAQTKFELAQAIAQKEQGVIIVNVNAIETRFINQYCHAHTIYVTNNASKDPTAYAISQAKQTISGINFQLTVAGKQYPIEANLYGTHHVANIALAFALAHSVGLSPETIIAALKLIPQISHRLEVVREKAKPIVIDDAYNSNPTGFASALELLKLFKEHGYRSILVTPGMIELGALHETKHFELGAKAAAVVDYALVIIPERIQAFIAGFNQHATKEQKLLTFNTFNEAKTWLQANTKETDAILLENDLPDLYESTVSF